MKITPAEKIIRSMDEVEQGLVQNILSDVLLDGITSEECTNKWVFKMFRTMENVGTIPTGQALDTIIERAGSGDAYSMMFCCLYSRMEGKKWKAVDAARISAESKTDFYSAMVKATTIIANTLGAEWTQ